MMHGLTNLKFVIVIYKLFTITEKYDIAYILVNYCTSWRVC